MSLNQPLLLSSALVHQVLLLPLTYPSKQSSSLVARCAFLDFCMRNLLTQQEHLNDLDESSYFFRRV